MQIRYTRDLERVHCGDAPSLYVVNQAYGEEIVESWIETQLYNLSEFAGCKGKIEIPQVEETARIIHSDYGFLNVAEIMLFCQKFKKCEYGKFYGAVDPMLILGALSDFVQERNFYLTKVENEKKREQERIKDEAERKLKDRYRRLFDDAFESGAEITYADFHWGGMYLLYDSEIPVALKLIRKKKVSKNFLTRYKEIKVIVDSVISQRKELQKK